MSLLKCWLDTTANPVVSLSDHELEQAGGALSLAKNREDDPHRFKRYYLFIRPLIGTLTAAQTDRLLAATHQARIAEVLATRDGQQFMVVSVPGQNTTAERLFYTDVLEYLERQGFQVDLTKAGEYREFLANL